jgi:hypothetical protein
MGVPAACGVISPEVWNEGCGTKGLALAAAIPITFPIPLFLSLVHPVSFWTKGKQTRKKNRWKRRKRRWGAKAERQYNPCQLTVCLLEEEVGMRRTRA